MKQQRNLDEMEVETPDGTMTLEAYLRTVPPENRGYIKAAIAQADREKIEAQKWVDRQLQDTLDVPAIIYKYIPCGHLEYGCPRSLRATQPPALNDFMECNVSTYMSDRKSGRDECRSKLSEAFTTDEFPLPREELKSQFALYDGPRISTVIQDYLAQFVGVVSFSTDPLIQTMWAHYAQNSGFVVGYNTQAMRRLGVELRKVLYMELAPAFDPLKDNMIRLCFVDEEGRKREVQEGNPLPGIPILAERDFVPLEKDWRPLARLLFVKGKSWEYEKEVRLLVDQQTTRIVEEKDEWPIRVLDIPPVAIEEVYVGTKTPSNAIKTMHDLIGKERRGWKLHYASGHAFRMEVTSTTIC